MSKSKLISLVVVTVLIVAAYYGLVRQKSYDEPDELTWEECIEMVGSVMQLTYPGTCVAPDGRRVVEPTSIPIELPDEQGGPASDSGQAVPGTSPDAPVPSGNSGSSFDNTSSTISWEECTSAPGSIMTLSSPGQCVTADGRRAVQPVE